MGDYSLKDANLDALTIDELIYLYESFNSQCIISHGHVTELVSQN